MARSCKWSLCVDSLVVLRFSFLFVPTAEWNICVMFAHLWVSYRTFGYWFLWGIWWIHLWTIERGNSNAVTSDGLGRRGGGVGKGEGIEIVKSRFVFASGEFFYSLILHHVFPARHLFVQYIFNTSFVFQYFCDFFEKKNIYPYTRRFNITWGGGKRGKEGGFVFLWFFLVCKKKIPKSFVIVFLSFSHSLLSFLPSFLPSLPLSITSIIVVRCPLLIRNAFSFLFLIREFA